MEVHNNEQYYENSSSSRLYVSNYPSYVSIYHCIMGDRGVGSMITFHLVIEDSEGNQVKITDFPKDVEMVLDDFVRDMEN